MREKIKRKLNLYSLQKKKPYSRLLSFLLSAALLFGSALSVSAEAPDKGSGAFILTYYSHVNDNTVRKYVFNTTAQSKVVCVYNRGTLYSGYLRQYGFDSVYQFYTLSADGNSVVELNLTNNGFTETDIATGDSEFHGFDTATGLSQFRYSAIRGSNYLYPSFSIDGTCPLITYFSARQDLGGIASVGPSGKDLAFAYLKTGKILSGANAYLSNWNSRSLSYGILSQAYGANIKTSSFSLLSPKVENGTFSHDGTIYDTSTLTRSGIVVTFYFQGNGNSFEYWVNLPLSVGSYDLNLKDFSSFTSGGKEYALYSLVFFPFVQEGADGFIYRGNSTSFSYSELLAAGCFEKGGNPIVNLNASPDKGDNVDSTLDPADREDGTAGNGTGGTGDGQHKGDMIEVPDTTDLLTLLRNMALNITKLPANISSSVVEALKTLPLAIANAYWDFIRDPLGTLVSLCKTIDEALGGFPTSIVQLGIDFGEYIAQLEVSIAQAVAEGGEYIALSLAEQMGLAGSYIVENMLKLGLDFTDWSVGFGFDIANLFNELGGIVARFGMDILTNTLELIATGKDIVEFALNLPEFLTGLWIPHEGYFQEKTDVIKERFAFVNSTLGLAKTIRGHIASINVNHAPFIVVPLSSTFLGNAGVEDVTVNFDWFLPYRSNFLTLVSAFLWIGFLFEQYFSLKHILNTTSGAVAVIRH